MEHMEGKTKTRNADRFRRYKEKNTEEYKTNDALRKKRARFLLKWNKDAYKEHKRKERERKHLAKHRKNFAINHPNLNQEPFQTSFSNSTVKSRTIKKVEKSLPQSSRKRNK